jgi:hypothetical protein
MSWHYRKVHWPHLSDHGTADITVSQLSVFFFAAKFHFQFNSFSQADVAVSVKESDGKGVVTVLSDACDIGTLVRNFNSSDHLSSSSISQDIHLHGGARYDCKTWEIHITVS